MKCFYKNKGLYFLVLTRFVRVQDLERALLACFVDSWSVAVVDVSFGGLKKGLKRVKAYRSHHFTIPVVSRFSFLSDLFDDLVSLSCSGAQNCSSFAKIFGQRRF